MPPLLARARNRDDLSAEQVEPLVPFPHDAYAPINSTVFPTQALLSVDPSGALTVALTVPGGATELMTVDVNGVPLRSFETPIALGARVGTERNGALWIVNESYDPTSTYWTLTPTRIAASQLLPRICGAKTWLRAVAGTSGVLATSVASCPPLLNGGFETGDFQGWNTSGASESISSTAHTGTFSAQLGLSTATNGDSSVAQTFTVPSTGGTLSFWYSITCPDTVNYDWFTATLTNASSGALLNTLTPKTCVPASGWTQVTANLAAYAGQRVTLTLTSHDDNYGADPTFTLVDDIGLQ